MKETILNIIKASKEPISYTEINEILNDTLLSNSIGYHIRALVKENPQQLIQVCGGMGRGITKRYKWVNLPEWKVLGFKSEEDFEVAMFEYKEWESWVASKEAKAIKKYLQAKNINLK